MRRRNYLYTFLLYLFHLPVYWISSVFVKNKKLWIFGAWFGEKYSDNSKYLFEHINNKQPHIKAVWLTHNKDILTHIRKLGYRAFFIKSIQGYWYSMRAAVGIVSTGTRDLNPFCIGRIQMVQLWHGTPLRKVLYDDIHSLGNISLSRKFFLYLFPYEKHDTNNEKNLIVTASDEVADIMAGAFGVNKSNLKITGYPRNDSFFGFSAGVVPLDIILGNLKAKDMSKGIYMPTHRNAGEFDVSGFFVNELPVINDFLQRRNIYLFIKLHHYDSSHASDIASQWSNIIMIQDQQINHDIYTILPKMDFLITDYSSVVFDFLLTERPIIFAPLDFKQYLQGGREFYYDYFKITPGPKANNWNEILMYIDELLSNPDFFAKERREIKNRFNSFLDGNNSERVYRQIIDCIGLKNQG